MKRVTIKDIAKLAGVSYATVSRALSGSSEISQATRERIIQICKEEGYRANSLARSLISNKTNVLGLIIPDITNPFYSELSFGVEASAREMGYNVMLCNSQQDNEQEQELFDFLVGHQVDGIILASSRNEASVWVSKYFKTIPTMLLGEASESDLVGSGINSVSVDNRYGGLLGAQYLYEMGHRSIVYLGHREGSSTHHLRTSGFTSYLQGKGIAPEVIVNEAGASSIEHGHRMGMELFSKPLRHTAIFAATDSLALGVLQAADECGVSIPEDVSLMGFDNIMYSGLPKIHLTTVDQRKPLLAQAAVQMLLGVLKDPSREEYTRRLIKPELVERSSCRRIE